MSETTRRIQKAFAKGKVFVPYLTAGDPDLAATEALVQALARAGAGVIELGVPFSDPLADGPVNARAASRALAGGATLPKVIALVKKLRTGGLETPLVLFTYFNPVFVMGVERFARDAAAAGADGVLCVDLPPEEAGEYRKLLAAKGLATIFLAAPTTQPERFALLDEASTGFVYYVSRTGVTGVGQGLPPTLEAELKSARAKIRQPLVVGFGISGPAQARQIARLADGVVIGSAIVRMVEAAREAGKNLSEIARDIEAFGKSIVTSITEKD